MTGRAVRPDRRPREDVCRGDAAFAVSGADVQVAAAVKAIYRRRELPLAASVRDMPGFGFCVLPESWEHEGGGPGGGAGPALPRSPLAARTAHRQVADPTPGARRAARAVHQRGLVLAPAISCIHEGLRFQD